MADGTYTADSGVAVCDLSGLDTSGYSLSITAANTHAAKIDATGLDFGIHYTDAVHTNRLANLTIQGLEVYNAAICGVRFGYGEHPAPIVYEAGVENALIKDLYIHDCNAGEGWTGEGKGCLALFESKDVVIEGNILENANGGDCLRFGGVTATGTGEEGDVITGDFVIRNNLIDKRLGGPETIRARGFTTADIYNNTLRGNGGRNSAAFTTLVGGNDTHTTLKFNSNLIENFEYVYKFDGKQITPADWPTLEAMIASYMSGNADYNLVDDGALVDWARAKGTDIPGGWVPYTHAECQTKFGIDANSPETSAGLDPAGAWGYELLSGSDAIDAGNPAASAALDIRGYSRDANPDIGAYEYGATGGVPGDTDGDGDVDLDDLFAVRNNFGTSSGATLADGDTDGDGEVDVDNLFAVGNNFGTGLTVP